MSLTVNLVTAMPTHRKWTFRTVQTPAYYRVNCPRLSAHFLVLVAGRCWCDKKKKVLLPLSFALPACAWSKNLSQIVWKFIAFAGVIYEKSDELLWTLVDSPPIVTETRLFAAGNFFSIASITPHRLPQISKPNYSFTFFLFNTFSE